jgi:hypothetical protein
MINNVFYILAAIVLVLWLVGLLPFAGALFYAAKFILAVAAIMVLIQLTTNRKLSP